MKVKIPPSVQQALNQAMTSCAMTGTIGGWDRVQAAVNRLGPEDHVEDLGAVLGLIEKHDMPQLIAALRCGTLMCRAVRNEIDATLNAAANN